MSSLEPSEIQGMVDDAVDSRYKHIDALLHELQRQLVVRWMVAMIGLVVVCGGIYFAVHQSSHTAHEAKATAITVAHQRHDAIVQNCVEQNKRHNNAINVLNGAINEYIRTHPKAKNTAELKQSVRDNVALISALQPHQNCQQLANQQAPLPPDKHS